MKRGGWIVVAMALCAVAVVGWWKFGGAHTQLADAGEPARSPSLKAASADIPDPIPESVPQPPVAPSSAPPLDYAAKLRAATDYLEFASALLPAARAGDHAAQFHLFRALDYCAIEYRAHVDQGNKRRSLDEALAWAATHWPHDTESVRLIYTRCHTYMEADRKDLGERGEWLRKAADGGFPLAQAIAANRQQLKGVSTTTDDAAREQESRRLMSLAVRSREPAVVWELASSSLGFQLADGDPDLNHFAVLLAACQRGFDCSSQSDAVKAACRLDSGCQPYETVTDIFRRWRSDNFPEIEARARWINEKLDAEDWEALGM